MKTILLAWNPKKFTWGDLEDELAQVRKHASGDSSWSVGNRRSLPIGTRFFMIRLGVEPRGIVASGRTTSEPYDDDHWDPEKAARGATARYVTIVFDYLSEKPLITMKELQRNPFDTSHWSTQMSGIEIPEQVASKLEVLWRSRTHESFLGRPEEYESEVGFHEGSLNRVYVNRYERNAKARRECLQKLGTSCSVCAKRMSELYSGVPDSLIQVHHLVPISAIGENYRVNPGKDLAPVCPNCHAVIHSEKPALNIRDARRRLR
jgi:5-methylcytosine-specific restriction protein A